MIRTAVWLQDRDNESQRFLIDGEAVTDARASDRAAVIARISAVTAGGTAHRWRDGRALFVRRTDHGTSCVLELPLTNRDTAGRVVLASVLVEGAEGYVPGASTIRSAAAGLDGSDLDERLPADMEERLRQLAISVERRGVMARFFSKGRHDA